MEVRTGQGPHSCQTAVKMSTDGHFPDSLELLQKYAKKQRGSSKAGGRTRHHMEKKQDIVHDITVTCVVVVVILNSYCMSATV